MQSGRTLMVLLLASTCAGTLLTSAIQSGKFTPSFSLKAFPHEARVGLINEHCTDKFFSTKLNFSTVNALLKSRALMLAAIDKDAQVLHMTREQYLREVEAAFRNFVESDELCGQEEVRAAVSAVLSKRKGSFGILLGGKSCAKSLILSKIVSEIDEQQKGSVILIDARSSGADLVQGIKKALSQDDWKSWADCFFAARNSGAEAAGAFLKMPFPGAAVQAARGPLRQHVQQKTDAVTLIEKFVEVHNKKGRTPCIIIDEANRALQDKAETLREQTINVLEIFTKLTKQDKKLNVLLACSEHAEPHRLRQLGFNANTFTKKIFAGEVPPIKMLKLLKRLNFGDHLAGLPVGTYGGHIWTMYQAIAGMLDDPEFTPMQVLPSSTTSSVHRCVRDEKADKEGMKGMRELLRALAETGSVRLLDEEDPRAERLSRENLAGVVHYFAVTAGIPPHAWRGKDFGLVPATQFTRLQIARALNQLDGED